MADHLVGGLHCAEATDLAAAFVLGALEPAEAAAVREHLAGCPEPHAEFAELGSVVPVLLAAVDPTAPPAGLKARILTAAATDAARPTPAPTATASPADTARPVVAPPVSTWPRIEPASRGWVPAAFQRPVWAAIGLAAVLAVVVLGGWNIALRNQVDDLTAYRNGVVAVLDQAARPGSQLAVLAAPDNASGPSGLAAVATNGSVALVLRDLTPTSGNQVYEAWLIGADGVPLPIGGFQVGAGGSASLATSPAASGPGVTVALTLEPGPGATKPTLPIVVVGKAEALAS